MKKDPEDKISKDKAPKKAGSESKASKNKTPKSISQEEIKERKLRSNQRKAASKREKEGAALNAAKSSAQATTKLGKKTIRQKQKSYNRAATSSAMHDGALLAHTTPPTDKAAKKKGRM